MTESRVQRLFLQAVQAYQQSGVVAGRHMHGTLRQIAAGSLYDCILTGLADAVEGRFEEALVAYNQALDMGTDSFKLVFVLKSDVLERLHRYDEAAATLDAGIAQAPGNLILYEIKAIFVLEIDRLSEVIGVYDALLHRRPSSVETLVFKSLALFLLGQTEQAWSVQRQVFSSLLDPSKLPAFQENWHTHLGQYKRLVDGYQHHHPTQADGWYWKGLILLIDNEPSGPFDEALAAFGRAIEADAAHAWAWNGKGMVLMAQGSYREATAAFAHAVSLLPIEGFVRNRRKASRAVEGEVSSRTAASSHTVHPPSTVLPRFSPLEVPPVEVLERLLHEERFDEALQVCEQLLLVARFSPGSVNGKAALRLKAYVLSALHRTDEAIAIFREILHRDPGETHARDGLAALLIEARRFPEVLELLSETPASQTTDASLLERRAGVLLMLRRYQEALEVAMRAHALDPGSLSISLVQIESLHHLGNISEALHLCEEALQTTDRRTRAFPLLLLSHAHLVLEAGRPLEALAIYEEALRREQEKRMRPIDDEAGALVEGFGPFPGDVITSIYGGMGNAWLSLEEGAKALACYDQALSFGPDEAYQKNRDLALALLLRDSDRTPAQRAEGIITPSTPEPAAVKGRGWSVQWAAVLTRLRARPRRS